MKCLVTGANGFLGSWLTRRLVADGHEVRILHRRSSQLDELTGLQFQSFIGDITDADSVNRACQGVEVVYHLAGLVGYSRQQRSAMEKINVGGTANVVAACLNNQVGRLLHLSSTVTIGASFDDQHLLNEESEYNVGHLNLGYFETKRAAEQIVLNAVRNEKLDSVIINPTTIYGAGDAKKGSRGVQLKVARQKFPFFTAGGTSIIAVEDVVHCIVEGVRTGRSGERYIVAGENIYVRDLFSIIAEEAGVEPPKILLPTPVLRQLGRAGDYLEKFGIKGPINSETSWTSTLFHWFDSSKAQTAFGFKPKRAREAIAASVRWIKENGLAER